MVQHHVIGHGNGWSSRNLAAIAPATLLMALDRPAMPSRPRCLIIAQVAKSRPSREFRHVVCGVALVLRGRRPERPRSTLHIHEPDALDKAIIQTVEPPTPSPN